MTKQKSLGLYDLTNHPLDQGDWLEVAIQAHIITQCRRKKIDVRGGLEGIPLTPRAKCIAKATGMDAGWPDLHFPFIHTWIELKGLKTPLKPHQIEIIDKLRLCGDHVHVVRARNPHDGWVQVEKILNAL